MITIKYASELAPLISDARNQCPETAHPSRFLNANALRARVGRDPKHDVFFQLP